MGVEFHHSFPLPQRISFYYPAANSIDLSDDYLKRDFTFIMAIGFKDGNNNIEWLGSEPYQINLTPYFVAFNKADSTKQLKISYEFCKNKPAMILTIEIANLSKSSKDYYLYTNLETSVKTYHTYKLKNKAWTEFDQTSKTLYTNFDDFETQSASIFVSNAGEEPESYSSKNFPLNQKLQQKDFDFNLGNEVIPENKVNITAARFIYKKTLKSNEKLSVVQF